MKDKVDKLIELKDKYQEAYDIYQQFKFEYDKIRLELLKDMSELGVKSLDQGKYLAVRREEIDVKLVDDKLAIEWVHNHPELEPDFYIGVKWAHLKPIVKTALKRDGEVIPGCELVKNESVSITEKKGKVDAIQGS